jgi:hypothetical protein
MNLFFNQYIIKEYYEKDVDAVLLEGDTFDILRRLPDNAY